MIIDLKMYPACFPVSTEAPEPFRDGFLETLRQASTTSKLSRPLSRRAGATTTAQNNASIVAPPDNDTLQSQQVGNDLEAGQIIIARPVAEITDAAERDWQPLHLQVGILPGRARKK